MLKSKSQTINDYTQLNTLNLKKNGLKCNSQYACIVLFMDLHPVTLSANLQEETDKNQHYPLVPDLVGDDNGYITYEPQAGPEYGDGSRHYLANAANEHSTPSLHEVRGRSDAQHGEGGMAAHVHFTDQCQQVYKISLHI